MFSFSGVQDIMGIGNSVELVSQNISYSGKYKHFLCTFSSGNHFVTGNSIKFYRFIVLSTICLNFLLLKIICKIWVWKFLVKFP